MVLNIAKMEIPGEQKSLCPDVCVVISMRQNQHTRNELAIYDTSRMAYFSNALKELFRTTTKTGDVKVASIPLDAKAK